VRGTEVAPELARDLASSTIRIPADYALSEIRRETVLVTMRDGVRLATDVYRPPPCPAPTLAMRTPYGRALREASLLEFARRGYVVVSQDCRGTGDSEPDHWDFSIYEAEDSVDFVEWVTRQEWFDGFLGSVGGSYVGWVQWCMAMHPAMSAIAPEVCGFGAAYADTEPAFHMFVNAYSRTVGKGENVTAERSGNVMSDLEQTERQLLEETLAGGYFNEPLHMPLPDALLERWPELRALPVAAARRALYERYSTLPPAGRVELVKLALGVVDFTYQSSKKLSALFGRQLLSYHYLFPRALDPDLFRRMHAPALIVTGWYDWGLGETLGSWKRVIGETREDVRSRSRLLIAPSAHMHPGYRNGREDHPELDRVYRLQEMVGVLLHWQQAVREDALDSWPTVIYYLLGANEWRAASAWPPPEATPRELYLAPDGALTPQPPAEPSQPDRYTYDPRDPTPTVGGSLISSLYTPGSVDVSEVQQRADVLTYTSEALDEDLDVVGPLRLILYASSSAVDTDFSARLSDVFSDGRAIQLQSVTLRARYRNPSGDPELLEPGRIYRLEIDMWATANRFRAGHRLRVDISSADFPKYDRNANRGGEPGAPLPAVQTVYHDPDHPSHLLLSVVATA
jgi:predicted acyl esterase